MKCKHFKKLNKKDSFCSHVQGCEVGEKIGCCIGCKEAEKRGCNLECRHAVKDVVEQAKEDRLEIDLAKQRQEVKEGAEARDKLAVIQTKEEKRLQEIGEKYLGGVPYERERVIGKAEAYLHQAAAGIMGAGKCFLAMKEAEKHGEWINIIEEKLKLSRVTVWRFMAAAKKLSNVSRVKHLNITGVGDGAGKFYALLNIPDEELAEFDETGLFRGATVEDINKMSVKDFRKLIAEKEDWKAKAKQFELEVQTTYDTKSRYTKKIEAQEKEIKKLRFDLMEAKKPLPPNSQAALKILADRRDDALANFYFLNNSDPSGHEQIVRLDLLNTAYFLRDIYANLADSIGCKYDTTAPCPQQDVEEQEKIFNETYKEYLDIEVKEYTKEDWEKRQEERKKKTEEVGSRESRVESLKAEDNDAGKDKAA